LLKFGPDAEVLEPVELRERVATAAGEVAALYGA
jgi:predicted DNA-binding transcriptional regulator YafY